MTRTNSSFVTPLKVITLGNNFAGRTAYLVPKANPFFGLPVVCKASSIPLKVTDDSTSPKDKSENAVEYSILCLIFGAFPFPDSVLVAPYNPQRGQFKHRLSFRKHSFIFNF